MSFCIIRGQSIAQQTPMLRTIKFFKRAQKKYQFLFISALSLGICYRTEKEITTRHHTRLDGPLI